LKRTKSAKHNVRNVKGGKEAGRKVEDRTIKQSGETKKRGSATRKEERIEE